MQRGSAETRSTSAHSHKAQSKLDDRYRTEDVGYTMVFLTDFGRQIDVPTPTMDGIIEITSTVLARDFRGEEQRTMASLALADYSVEQLSAI
jgi:opine dehydrogenase